MGKKLLEWIFEHRHIIVSPLKRDILILKDPATKKKVLAPKLLLEITIRELHNDLIKTNSQGGLPGTVCYETGKILISDTTLRQF